MACTTCKENYHIMCKILVCSVLREKLCHVATFKRSENRCLHSNISENLRYINAVHNCSKHTNLVSLCAVDGLTRSASPEVSTTDNNTYLCTIINNLFNLFCNLNDCSLIKAVVLITCKCLTT